MLKHCLGDVSRFRVTTSRTTVAGRTRKPSNVFFFGLTTSYYFIHSINVDRLLVSDVKHKSFKRVRFFFPGRAVRYVTRKTAFPYVTRPVFCTYLLFTSVNKNNIVRYGLVAAHVNGTARSTRSMWIIAIIANRYTFKHCTRSNVFVECAAYGLSRVHTMIVKFDSCYHEIYYHESVIV